MFDVRNYATTWIDLLSGSTHERLANCTSRKEDIRELVQAKYTFRKASHPEYQPEDALVYILELFDCNSIDCDLTKEEYESILSSIT